jgi:hypothetical protein
MEQERQPKFVGDKYIIKQVKTLLMVDESPELDELLISIYTLAHAKFNMLLSAKPYYPEKAEAVYQILIPEWMIWRYNKIAEEGHHSTALDGETVVWEDDPFTQQAKLIQAMYKPVDDLDWKYKKEGSIGWASRLDSGNKLNPPYPVSASWANDFGWLEYKARYGQYMPVETMLDGDSRNNFSQVANGSVVNDINNFYDGDPFNNLRAKDTSKMQMNLDTTDFTNVGR